MWGRTCQYRLMMMSASTNLSIMRGPRKLMSMMSRPMRYCAHQTGRAQSRQAASSTGFCVHRILCLHRLLTEHWS